MKPRKRVLTSGKTVWDARWIGPDGKEKSRACPTEKEAKRYAAKKETEIAEGTYVDPASLKITLRTLAKEASELAADPDTRNQHRYYASQLGEIGDYPIGKLRNVHIQRWVNQLSEGRPWADGKPLSPTVVRSMAIWVRGQLKRAVQERMIPHNPAERMSLPDLTTAVTPNEIPTLEQVQDFIDTLNEGLKVTVKEDDHERVKKIRPHPLMARIVVFMASTGLRPSEIAGLRWPDVDMDARELTVHAQANRKGNGFKATKTAKGVRVVPFPDDVVQVLKEQQKVEKPTKNLVFPSARGAMLNAGRMGDIWRKYAPHTPMRDFSLYSLRHFFASRQIAAGVSPKAVSEVMGHKNASITLQVYTHLWAGDRDRVREAAAGILRDNSGISGSGGMADVIDLAGQRAAGE